MRSRLTGLAVAVVVGLLVGLAFTAGGLHLRKVTSGSMSPTFAIGSWVVTSEHDASADALDRGDVVVFHYPFGSDLVAVKRVVALPGDRVAATTDKVTVNSTSQPVLPTGAELGPGAAEHVLPAGSLFVLGDNSAASIDSRSFGDLPRGEIAGHVVFALPASPLVLVGGLLAGCAGVTLLSGTIRRTRRRSTLPACTTATARTAS